MQPRVLICCLCWHCALILSVLASLVVISHKVPILQGRSGIVIRVFLFSLVITGIILGSLQFLDLAPGVSVARPVWSLLYSAWLLIWDIAILDRWIGGFLDKACDALGRALFNHHMRN